MKLHKVAFITGITGQDGAHLAQFLLAKGYVVHGLVRWDCVDTTARLQSLALDEQSVHLHFGDLNDANNIAALIKTIQPDEIYNLAALSHVKVSFETPASALDTNAKGALNIFDAVRLLDLEGDTKIYQASSSEMFGSAPAPQSEDTPMHPCSPYGVAKLAAYHMGRVYRDSYGMFISNGILFNHESPLRGEDFVTRKITRAVAAIEAGTQENLTLGNLDALRDWGHARDYVRGMWMMMQHDTPDDFVLATGRARSVREFVERAFAFIGNLDALRDWGHARDYVRGMWMMMQQGHADDFVLATGRARSVREFVERAFAFIGKHITWQGEGLGEQGIDAKTGKVLVSIDEAFFRPKEVNHLLGDAAKAKATLGWQPEITFDQLIADMINADRAALTGADTWQKTG